MEPESDAFITSLVKEEISRVLARLKRESRELSSGDRDKAAARLVKQSVAEVLATRPDLMRRFGDVATEYYLAEMVRQESQRA